MSVDNEISTTTENCSSSDQEITNVLSIGRNLSEYKCMFMLKDNDLQSNILDIGAGPSSFNSEVKAQGNEMIVSVDPIYAFSLSELNKCVNESIDMILEDVTENQNRYNWNSETHPNIDSLFSTRHATMAKFLTDFERDRSSYLVGTVLSLPFPDNHFDLALSSHFLVLYSEQLGTQFHIDAIRELCRVSKEIRIYPLINLAGEMPLLLIKEIRRAALELGMRGEIVEVNYEFMKGANSMLKLYQARKTMWCV